MASTATESLLFSAVKIGPTESRFSYNNGYFNVFVDVAASYD